MLLSLHSIASFVGVYASLVVLLSYLIILQSVKILKFFLSWVPPFMYLPSPTREAEEHAQSNMRQRIESVLLRKMKVRLTIYLLARATYMVTHVFIFIRRIST